MGELCQVYKRKRTKKERWSNLVVDLEFLHHPQLHKHPQSSRYHGVNVQREIIKGQLIDAQLANQGDVSSLLSHGQKETWRRKTEIEENMSSESRGGWRGQRTFSDDTWKYRDMLIKTLRTHWERVKINEGEFHCYLFSELIDEHSCAAVIIKGFFFHYEPNINTQHTRDSN